MEQWLQDRLEWFQDMKFGFFVHWGIYSQWECIESWPLVEVDTWARPDHLKAWTERGKDIERFKRDYRDLNQTFNPTAFDPAPWVDAAKTAGMKYFVFTTKHHDGFCMFDTQQTDYRITHPDCPYSQSGQPDVARALFDAFRDEGFGIGVYFSKSDWHTPYYWSPDAPARDRNPNYDTLEEPEKWAKFVTFVHGQIEELMTNYGDVDILWLDGGQVRPPQQDIQMDQMVAMARQHQPELIVVDRTVGGEHENYRTPERTVPDVPPDYVWESCITMGEQWSYRAEDRYQSTREIIHLLVDIVSKGGNLLLNVGPQPDGQLPEIAVSRMQEIGEWMAVNSEAIYGTRAIAPYKEGQVALTQKQGRVYATYLMNEDEERPPTSIRLSSITRAPDSPVFMLGVDQPLTWRQDGSGICVDIPDSVIESPPCQHAVVLKMQLG